MSKPLKSALFLLLISASLSCSTGHSASSPAGQPRPQDEYAASARLFIAHLAKGEFAQAATDFDDEMKKAAAPEMLRQIWGELETKFGDFKEQGEISMADAQAYRIALVKCRFERSDVTLRVVFNGRGQIVGFFIN